MTQSQFCACYSITLYELRTCVDYGLVTAQFIKEPYVGGDAYLNCTNEVLGSIFGNTQYEAADVEAFEAFVVEQRLLRQGAREYAREIEEDIFRKMNFDKVKF